MILERCDHCGAIFPRGHTVSLIMTANERIVYQGRDGTKCSGIEFDYDLCAECARHVLELIEQHDGSDGNDGRKNDVQGAD